MRVAFLLGVTYLVLAAALIGIAGCQAHYETKQCFSIKDCGDGRVCFLGTCQTQNFSIQSVLAELTPPSTTDYLTQQTPSALDLTAGYQSVVLAPTYTLSGMITGADGAAHGGTLVARRTDTIPGHDIIRRTPVDETMGYALRATPGLYALTFVPAADPAASPGDAQPPLKCTLTTLATSAQQQSFTYPAKADLGVYTGRVLYDAASGGIEGAYVSASALDSLTGDTLTSTTDVTAADGSYTLVLPPRAQAPFTITVRPDGNPIVPEVVMAVHPVTTGSQQLEDIAFGATTFTMGAVIRDGAGQPVQLADVFFEGSNVGTAPDSHYTAHLTTDALGMVQAALFPAQYVVTVVPTKTDLYNAVTSTTPGTLDAGSAGTPLAVQVGGKVQLTGLVRTHGGAPMGGATVRLAFLDAPTTREYTVTTDASGGYPIALDPGDYDITVEPPVGSPDPRYHGLEHVTPGQTAMPIITLYKPTFVYGRVLDPTGQVPVAGVTIAFYSSELSAGTTPLLVGLGITDAKGEFAVPLPTQDGT